MDIVERHLKDMGTTWDAEELVTKVQNGINVWPNSSIWMRD